MLSSQGTNITITRGDSAYITVSITDSKGNPYTPGPDDKIRWYSEKLVKMLKEDGKY